MLKIKHSTLLGSFSWQYTPNFNCFYLYVMAQIQLDSSKSSRKGYTLILEYTIFNVDFMCATVSYPRIFGGYH